MCLTTSEGNSLNPGDPRLTPSKADKDLEHQSQRSRDGETPDLPQGLDGGPWRTHSRLRESTGTLRGPEGPVVLDVGGATPEDGSGPETTEFTENVRVVGPF